MSGRKRIYSDEEKGLALVALDANNGNVARAARQLRIPRVTLLAWSQNRHVGEEVSNIRHLKKGELAERLEDLAHQLIDALPDKLADASLQQLSTSLGIAIDKMLLLKGQPIQITKTAEPTYAAEPTYEEKREEVKKWLAEMGLLESDHDNN